VSAYKKSATDSPRLWCATPAGLANAEEITLSSDEIVGVPGHFQKQNFLFIGY
jgi:hypothetical protein